MGRAIRGQTAGGTFHVYVRGNNREPIFLRETDRLDLGRRIGTATALGRLSLFAYAFMGNHVHALVSTQKPLGVVLRSLFGGYAVAFNLRHKRSGHLFGGRFGAAPCRGPDHFRRLVAYIHLNPVKHGFASDPSAYLWTSHRWVLGLRAPGPKICLEHTLSAFGPDPGAGLRGYLRWLDDWRAVLTGTEDLDRGESAEPPPDESGSAEAVRSCCVVTASSMRAEAVARKCSATTSIPRFVDAAAAALQIPVAALRGSNKSAEFVRARDLLCFSLVAFAGFPPDAVATWIRRDPSNVLRAIRRCANLRCEDPHFASRCDSLATLFKSMGCETNAVPVPAYQTS